MIQKKETAEARTPLGEGGRMREQDALPSSDGPHVGSFSVKLCTILTNAIRPVGQVNGLSDKRDG
jgi:hypothetical protein